MGEKILYERDGAIVTLTLNEPETRNAIADEMIAELVEIVAGVNADPLVSCVIVTGAGNGFSSGGNLKEMQRREGHFDETGWRARRKYRHGIQKIPLALYDIECPTIAAVNGPAVGAGCDLALMCDIRIASEKATFAESFLRVGLVSGDGGAWFLPRVVGLSRAYEMTFTGDFLDARQAQEYGLVSRVVPHEALLDEARALAGRIACHPPHALRMTKRLIRKADQMSLDDSLEMAAAMQALVLQTDDHKEAYQAMLAKRKPSYRGS